MKNLEFRRPQNTSATLQMNVLGVVRQVECPHIPQRHYRIEIVGLTSNYKLIRDTM